MIVKSRLQQAFKNRALKPLLKKMESLEQDVINRPGAFYGGEKSPVRFNIPRERLELEGDYPPIRDFPDQCHSRLAA